jgi:hypothetical protein
VVIAVSDACDNSFTRVTTRLALRFDIATAQLGEADGYQCGIVVRKPLLIVKSLLWEKMNSTAPYPGGGIIALRSSYQPIAESVAVSETGRYLPLISDSDLLEFHYLYAECANKLRMRKTVSPVVSCAD